jgi:hypothetical protein
MVDIWKALVIPILSTLEYIPRRSGVVFVEGRFNVKRAEES